MYIIKISEASFTDKIKICSKISAKGETPTEFEEVISYNFVAAETFNRFFVNVVPNLEISPEETSLKLH